MTVKEGHNFYAVCQAIQSPIFDFFIHFTPF